MIMEDKPEEDILRDFFQSFIKVHILHHASENPVYGLWLIEELGRHGYSMSPGTLYPLLHSLEKVRFLRSEKKTVGGKVRIYYSTTSLGRRVLSRAREKIREMIAEIMKESQSGRR